MPERYSPTPPESEFSPEQETLEQLAEIINPKIDAHRINMDDFVPLYGRAAVEADKKQVAIAQRRFDARDYSSRESKINGLILEHLVSSADLMPDMFADELPKPGTTLSSDEPVRPAQIIPTAKYDDFFNHIDALCVHGGSGDVDVNQLSAFSFDMTTDVNYRNLSKKMANNFINGGYLGTVKYGQVAGAFKGELENLPIFTAAVEPRNGRLMAELRYLDGQTHFSDYSPQQRAELLEGGITTLNKILLVQLCTEAFVMKNINAQELAETGETKRRIALKAGAGRLQSCYDYFAGAIMKKAVAEESNAASYLSSIPDKHARTLIAFYLSELINRCPDFYARDQEKRANNKPTFLGVMEQSVRSELRTMLNRNRQEWSF